MVGSEVPEAAASVTQVNVGRFGAEENRRWRDFPRRVCRVDGVAGLALPLHTPRSPPVF